MGLFETNPWLLVPLIVATVEGWDLVKRTVRRWLARRANPDVIFLRYFDSGWRSAER